MSAMFILHDGIECSMYEYTRDDKRCAMVSPTDGHDSYFASASVQAHSETGEPSLLIEITTSTGTLVLDKRGASHMVESVNLLMRHPMITCALEGSR